MLNRKGTRCNYIIQDTAFHFDDKLGHLNCYMREACPAAGIILKMKAVLERR